MEVSEETGYLVTAESLVPIKSFVGAAGIAGTQLKMFYAEVSNAQVFHNLYFIILFQYMTHIK